MGRDAAKMGRSGINVGRHGTRRDELWLLGLRRASNPNERQPPFLRGFLMGRYTFYAGRFPPIGVKEGRKNSESNFAVPKWPSTPCPSPKGEGSVARRPTGWKPILRKRQVGNLSYGNDRLETYPTETTGWKPILPVAEQSCRCPEIADSDYPSKLEFRSSKGIECPVFLDDF